MTVSILTTEMAYNGNGTVGPFAYSFKIFNATDLTVYVTSAAGVISTLQLDTHYTVAGAGEDNGGSISLTSGDICPVGAGLTIQRDLPILQQLADFVEGQAMSPELLESVFDYLTLLVQDMNRRASERDAQIATLEAALLGTTIVGLQLATYVMTAAEGPIVLPVTGGIAMCAKSRLDETATALDVEPGSASHTIEGATKYRDGLTSPGESVLLVFIDADNTWYKFG